MLAITIATLTANSIKANFAAELYESGFLRTSVLSSTIWILYLRSLDARFMIPTAIAGSAVIAKRYTIAGVIKAKTTK